MEKHLIKILMVGLIVMGLLMYYFGIIITGVILFSIALVLFIVGAVYVLITTATQFARDYRNGIK